MFGVNGLESDNELIGSILDSLFGPRDLPHASFHRGVCDRVFGLGVLARQQPHLVELAMLLQHALQMMLQLPRLMLRRGHVVKQRLCLL